MYSLGGLEGAEEVPGVTRTGRERWHWHGQRRVFCRARRGLSTCVGAGWRGGALAVAPAFGPAKGGQGGAARPAVGGSSSSGTG